MTVGDIVLYNSKPYRVCSKSWVCGEHELIKIMPYTEGEEMALIPREYSLRGGVRVDYLKRCDVNEW